MNRTEIKNRYNKVNPSDFGLFKGYEPVLPEKREPVQIIFRPGSYDFVVDWQMKDKPFKENGKK
jgi:hypothetical protein